MVCRCRGAFSQVRLAQSKEDPTMMYAIKIIDKKALKGKEESLENEIKVLRRYVHQISSFPPFLLTFCATEHTAVICF